VSISELKVSFGRFFWSVMNVAFVFWVVGWVIAALSQEIPAAAILPRILYLAAFLMAAPEEIALRGTYGGLATLQQAAKFFQEKWPAWLPPNLLFAAIGYGLAVALQRLPIPGVVGMGVLGALFHLVMVFRGHLFVALDGTSHRQRMFELRNAAE
jgi:hypothetical protein